jgi:beta-mannosidase
VPGSPFSPAGTALVGQDGEPAGELHPNDERVGSTHFWETWNRLDYTAFEGYTSRFVAEFGWQAPASWPTLVRAIGAEPGADDERLAVHQKAGNGRELLRTAIARHLPAPADGPGWYVAGQLVQARAVTASVPHFRSLHDICSGTIWWQHNDCWPAVSWSIVDVAGRRKLAWYAVRSAFAPRISVLGGSAQAPWLTLVNDTATAWAPRIRLRTWHRDGSVHDLPAPPAGQVTANGHLVLPLPALGTDADLLVADVDDVRTTRWLRPDLELAPPTPTLGVDVVPAGADGVTVRVASDVLVRDLCLVAELVAPDAVVDRQLVTLLPGEATTFTVTGPGAGRLDAARVVELLHHDARLRQPPR